MEGNDLRDKLIKSKRLCLSLNMWNEIVASKVNRQEIRLKTSNPNLAGDYDDG